MKIIFALLTIFLINCNKAAIPVGAGGNTVYPIGISFNSICCGPPSEDFLKTFVNKFNKANNVKITADKIAGCGREGEFVVLFGLGSIKIATREKFIAEVEQLIPVQEAANKSASTSSGGLAVLHNAKSSEYNHCRIKSQNWEY